MLALLETRVPELAELEVFRRAAFFLRSALRRAAFLLPFALRGPAFFLRAAFLALRGLALTAIRTSPLERIECLGRGLDSLLRPQTSAVYRRVDEAYCAIVSADLPEKKEFKREHPAIAECAVVGVENEQGLTKPVAFVTLKAEATEDELKQHVLDRLDAYKHPRQVVTLEEMPRTHLGKIDRGRLKALAR